MSAHEEINHRADCYEIEPGKFCDCPPHASVGDRSDPVEAVAAEVRAMRRRMFGATWNAVTAEDRAIARQLLTKVWARGWRLLRTTDSHDAYTPDPDLAPREETVVVAEWTPEAVR